MNKYTLTIESEEAQEIDDAINAGNIRSVLFQILADLRQGYKYGNMAWLKDFDHSGITDSDGEEMCLMFADYVRETMHEFGVRIE